MSRLEARLDLIFGGRCDDETLAIVEDSEAVSDDVLALKD